MNDKQEMSDHRENMREFKDRLGNPISQEEREAIMGISNTLDMFKIEYASLAAQLEQLRMEKGELEDLRNLRDSVAMLFRSGAYNLEKAAGYIEGKSVVAVVVHCLLAERRRWWVRLRAWFGRPTW